MTDAGVARIMEAVLEYSHAHAAVVLQHCAQTLDRRTVSRQFLRATVAEVLLEEQLRVFESFDAVYGRQICACEDLKLCTFHWNKNQLMEGIKH